MRTQLEAAVAHEVLAEIKDQGRTYKWVQEKAGVKPRAWGYYFTGGRPIPFHVLADVCEVLGVKPSDMVARAELAEAAAPPAPVVEDDDTTRELMGGLSPRNQRKVQAIREAHAKANPPKRQDKSKRKPT